MLHPETTNAGESEDVSYFFAVLYAVFLYFCVYLVTDVDTRAGNTGRKEGIRHNNVPLHKANQMCGLSLDVLCLLSIKSNLYFFCPMQLRFFPQKTNKLGAIWRLSVIVQ